MDKVDNFSCCSFNAKIPKSASLTKLCNYYSQCLENYFPVAFFMLDINISVLKCTIDKKIHDLIVNF